MRTGEQTVLSFRLGGGRGSLLGPRFDSSTSSSFSFAFGSVSSYLPSLRLHASHPPPNIKLARHRCSLSRTISNGVYTLCTSCFRLSIPQFRPLNLSYNHSEALYGTACFATSPAGKKEKRGKVIVISGPTGAGKSRLALELAKHLGGEIISADSVQVYKGLDVGSAKPPLSDQQEVPHHLIDILHPSEDYSVGQYFKDARQATESVMQNGRVPIVTGGTGLYLRWFMYGKPNVPKASPEIASQVYSELADLRRNEDWDAAVQLVVKAGDPNAQFIATNNWYRLGRSLEIIKSSGSPPSAFQVPYESFKEQCDLSSTGRSNDVDSLSDELDELKSKELDYDFICFFLSTQRLDLYRLIDNRCEDMLSGSDGILSEAKWLLDSGLLPNSNSATRAIGYRHAMEYLLRSRQNGGSSPGEFFAFLSEFQKASRNFAKRQLTWFRNEQIYHWLDASKPMETILQFICEAYNDHSGNLFVPEHLRMKKNVSNRREVSDLNAYRTRNRLDQSSSKWSISRTKLNINISEMRRIFSNDSNLNTLHLEQRNFEDPDLATEVTKCK